MGVLRGDAALEHVEVGALDRLEAAARDHVQPAARPLAERVPGIGDPGLEPGRAPVLGSLGDAIRREEQGRARAGKLPLPAGAELLSVREADRQAVGQVVAVVLVHRPAHLAVAGDVDVGRGAGLERVDRVIEDGPPVDPEALDELGAPR